MKISELKGNINDIYKEIGKVVYEAHTTGKKQNKSEIEELCTKIDVLGAEIDANLKECLELKDKKQCDNCYKEIEKDAKFCPDCGKEQPTTNQDVEAVREETEEEEAKEVEVLEKEPQEDNTEKED